MTTATQIAQETTADMKRSVLRTANGGHQYRHASFRFADEAHAADVYDVVEALKAANYDDIEVWFHASGSVEVGGFDWFGRYEDETTVHDLRED